MGPGARSHGGSGQWREQHKVEQRGQGGDPLLLRFYFGFVLTGTFSSRERERRQDICPDLFQAIASALWYNPRCRDHRSGGTVRYQLGRALLRVRRYLSCGFHSGSLPPWAFTSMSHSTGFLTPIVI